LGFTFLFIGAKKKLHVQSLEAKFNLYQKVCLDPARQHSLFLFCRNDLSREEKGIREQEKISTCRLKGEETLEESESLLIELIFKNKKLL